MTAFNPPPPVFEGFRLVRQGPRTTLGGIAAWSTMFFRVVGLAATEGFRLIRREPVSALVWLGLWLGAFLFAGAVLATGGRVVVHTHSTYSSLSEIGRRFGSFAVVSIAVFLLVWATTTVAVYRAVLRSHDRRFFFLRVGADEVRLAVMTIISFVIVLVFGGAPAYLLFVLAEPFMRAMPAMARDIATVGALATVVVEIWLGVRLSLIAVETVAERRFHLTAYWPLARGRFWFLLCSYFLCFLMVFCLSVIFFVLGAGVWSLAHPELGGGNLLRRTGLLGLAAVWAVLAASFSLLSSTVFCACQAYAFGSIASDGKAGVAIS
jgi:hypothetical protein